jgi:hypothetical protein
MELTFGGTSRACSVGHVALSPEDPTDDAGQLLTCPSMRGKVLLDSCFMVAESTVAHPTSGIELPLRFGYDITSAGLEANGGCESRAIFAV